MRRVRAVAVAVIAAAVLPMTHGVAFAGDPVPDFTGGEARPVFDPTDVLREEAWVTAPVDSDRDGRPDETHVEIVRPRATVRGLRSPVVFMPSPYFAGTNQVPNHNVDVELFVPGRPGSGQRLVEADPASRADRLEAALGAAARARAITSRYESYLLARGYAIVYGESLGTGRSTGCPTTGGRNETIGVRSVIDWLRGRAPARDAANQPVIAGWNNGRIGMQGTSYNGTLPNAAASTGVEGLRTIVPIAAISSWYDYYRDSGAVIAPGGFQGEDADVLAHYVHSRPDRSVCAPVIAELTEAQDRRSGDYNAFWDERNYVNQVSRVRASVLAVHGLNDWNVKTKQVTQWYEALRAHGVEHRIWLHQSGHADPITLRRDEWLRTLNRWYTHYLWGVDNGADKEPKATVQREDGSWTDESDWPPASADEARLYPQPGGEATGALDPRHPVPGSAVRESLRDDAAHRAEDLAAAPRSGNRLAYLSVPARQPLRISGTPTVNVDVSVDRAAANVTALLVDRAPTGRVSVITRGWADPQNRTSISRSEPVEPGRRYALNIVMQPDDYLLPAGHQLGLVLLSSDHDHTLRPKAGTELTFVINTTSLSIPAVGGQSFVNSVLSR